MPAFTVPETLSDDPAILTDTMLEAGDALRELHSRRPDTSDREAVSNWQRDVRSLTDFIHLADPILSAEARRERPTGGAGTLDVGSDTAYTPGDEFVRSGAFENRGERGVTDAVEVRTLLTTGSTDPAAGLWMPRGTPIPPMRRRMRMFVRDLIAVTGTTLNSVPYIRELNPATNEVSATAVSEGAAKPEVTMQFESADAPTRKLAAWLPITEEIAQDAPTLRGYINERLGYMLALREEAQILLGNGVSPALRGIFNTSGVQAQAYDAVSKLTTLGLAIGKVEAVDGEADGIVMNPSDYWTMMTTRIAAATGELDVGQGSGGPFGTPPSGVWGVPVVRSRQVPVGSAYVGAWRLGATLFDREQTTIRTTDSHSDYFIYNKLVILAEERVALAVNRPDLFVVATLS